ncbi:MAG: DUF4870 domain-containing protein, partial [Armatimonadota bacterium]|nr:DUF4870 domain-containing protein [Armatimonadota bacterium]
SPLVPSSAECIMAALAHLSVLLPHFGIFVPLLLWIVNSSQAPFAAYQAKQAFFFQLFDIVFTWLIVFLAFVFGLFSIGAIVGGSTSGAVAFGSGVLSMLLLICLLWIGPIIYGVVGAIHSSSGRDFRYWLIGEWVQPN